MDVREYDDNGATFCMKRSSTMSTWMEKILSRYCYYSKLDILIKYMFILFRYLVFYHLYHYYLYDTINLGGPVQNTCLVPKHYTVTVFTFRSLV